MNDNPYLNMSQALDELVNGPTQHSLQPEPSNPIPSAPPNIENQGNDVFNPLALTIDIPSVSAIPVVDISGGDVSLSDISDTSDTSDTDTSDDSSVVMPSTTAGRIGNPIGRRIAAHTRYRRRRKKRTWSFGFFYRSRNA